MNYNLKYEIISLTFPISEGVGVPFSILQRQI